MKTIKTVLHENNATDDEDNADENNIVSPSVPFRRNNKTFQANP